MGICQRHHQPFGGSVWTDFQPKQLCQLLRAVRLLRRLLLHGVARRFVHQKVLVQNRLAGRAGAIRTGRFGIHSRRQRWRVPAVPHRILCDDLRTEFSGNQCQPLHPFDGSSLNRDPASEPGPVVQSTWLDRRHPYREVRHPFKHQFIGWSQTSGVAHRRIRSDEVLRPSHRSRTVRGNW